MLRTRDLKANKVSKLGLIRLFTMKGFPITYPSLLRRLKDQKWSYAHGFILRKTGLWVEPAITISNDEIEEIYSIQGGRKPVDGTLKPKRVVTFPPESNDPDVDMNDEEQVITVFNRN